MSGSELTCGRPADGAEVITLRYSNGDVYKGEVHDSTRHGKGSLTCSNGDTYSGGWRLDRREGQGRLALSSGLVYSGAWRNDMANGQGWCQYRDGRRYEGEWLDDQRDGWGLLTTQEGDQYEGEWRDDQPHGNGRWTHADGSYYQGSFTKGERLRGKFVSSDGGFEYQGEFKDDLRHGEGSCIQRGLLEYTGSWQADLRHGSGIAHYVDGSRYEGEWRDDRRDGAGCLTRQDGYRYQGEWRDDQPHGTGSCRFENGDVYKGQWQQGQRHGKGGYKSAAGDKYQGEWEHDKRHGMGTCIYANGDKYRGQWKENQRHGWGSIVFADGVRFQGLWEEDQWIQSTADPLLSRPSGPGLRKAVAGQNASFIIQARDEVENRRLSGGDVFNVRLTNPGEPSWSLQAAVEDRGDGTYLVTYCTEVAGQLLLHITTGEPEEDVADSPYTVQVAAACPAARRCTATGPGRRLATCGVPCSFHVEARDRFGNRCMEALLASHLPIEVELRGSRGEVAVSVEADCEGRYLCTYTPGDAGLHRLAITSGGTHISGSPFSVQVCPAGHDGSKGIDEAMSSMRLVDEVKRWGEVADQQLLEDGQTAGGGEDAAPQTEEERFIKEHPDVPVVERLQDMWKVSKVLQLRKQATK